MKCCAIVIIIYSLSVIYLLLLAPLGASSSFDASREPSENVPSCPARCLKERKELTGSRIFYLVILHNERTLNDAVHLFRAIRDPRNTILIHVDAKAKHLLKNQTTLLHQEIKSCSCGSAVRIESVHDVKWSHWSMNLPTLWGLQLAVEEYSGQWDVFINLSGDNLPVYMTNTMADTLAHLPYNFVTSSSCETGIMPTSVYVFPSWWHKRAHYTNRDKQPDPGFEYATQDGKRRNQTMITHFGSQWVILQADFCAWLVQELKRQDSLPSLYQNYLIASEKLMTDETFIPTLIMHIEEFKETQPKVDDQHRLLWKNGSVSDITAVRYERMDEHVPTAFGYFWTQQRYEVPKHLWPTSLAYGVLTFLVSTTFPTSVSQERCSFARYQSTSIQI